MICIPVIDKEQLEETFRKVQELQRQGWPAGMEIRLDLCRLSERDISRLPDLHEMNVILTYRCDDRAAGCLEEKVECGACASMRKLRGELTESFQQMDLFYTERLLSALMDKGAGLIDLGDEMDAYWSSRWQDLARRHGCRIILSHHDFEKTEDVAVYSDFYHAAVERGADYVKIVSTARDTADAIRVLRLYRELPARRLIAFAMGQAGRFSRIEACRYGSPVTYVALKPGAESASGQLELDSFLKAIAPDRFTKVEAGLKSKQKNSVIRIDVPASKSYAQRLILCAALSGRKTILTHYTECNDNRSAIEMARKFNAGIEYIPGDGNASQLVIEAGSLPESEIQLEVNESGLCTRIAIALGAFFRQTVTVNGKGSVLNRSFSEECRILEENGIEVVSDNGKLPISVKGHFAEGTETQIRTRLSSQFASGLLIGRHFAEKTLGYPVGIQVDTLVSRHYLEITEACLQEIGKEVIAIEGDWSSAANLCAASLLSGKETLLGNISPKSLQPDAGILPLIQKLGARITEEPDGIRIVPSPGDPQPAAFRFDAADSPDLFPVLAVLALHCRGTSELTGISRLVNKESNRLESIYCMLTAFSGDNRGIDIEADTLRITGREGLTEGVCLCRCYNDHRIAMAALLAGLRHEGALYLDNLSCTGKSYPGFLEEIGKFGREE